MAVAMIIVGLVIGFGAFVYAAKNMMSDGGSFDGMFKNHIKAMIVMALGGLIATIGFLLGGWQILQGLLAQ